MKVESWYTGKTRSASYIFYTQQSVPFPVSVLRLSEATTTTFLFIFPQPVHSHLKFFGGSEDPFFKIHFLMYNFYMKDSCKMQAPVEWGSFSRWEVVVLCIEHGLNFPCLMVARGSHPVGITFSGTSLVLAPFISKTILVFCFPFSFSCCFTAFVETNPSRCQWVLDKNTHPQGTSHPVVRNLCHVLFPAAHKHYRASLSLPLLFPTEGWLVEMEDSGL